MALNQILTSSNNLFNSGWFPCICDIRPCWPSACFMRPSQTRFQGPGSPFANGHADNFVNYLAGNSASNPDSPDLDDPGSLGLEDGPSDDGLVFDNSIGCRSTKYGCLPF